MRERGLSIGMLATAAGSAALVALLLTLALGRGGGGAKDAGANAGASATPGAVELVEGVPVGVLDTPAGALAAGDNYVALASQTVEQDPRTFAALVAQAWLPSSRAWALAQAQRIRGSDLANVRNYAQGGRGLALVAARRLDSYTPAGARVTTWLGGFVWGLHLAPRQTWNLVETVLRWQSGRWLVASSETSSTPAPVPAIVYLDGGNDRAGAFARLAGMSAPLYGTGG